jgi:DNA repair protein RadA/Sms
MAKVKKAYFCRNCGTEHGQWMGQCKSCGEWNTLVEEVISRGDEKIGTPNNTNNSAKASSKNLNEISFSEEHRFTSSNRELDRVLGGGIVPGSLVLLGGEPGIGKSTLMLQVAINTKRKVLYISGEESQKQLKMRADRLGINNPNIYVLTETLTRNIFQQIEEIEPELVVIDSIQTLQTDIIDASPGSISQIRETTSEWLRYAKKSSVPVFLIGHITKEGQLAGPKLLEHMVDVVLQFEGDNNFVYRLLRAHKNRFGSTQELGIYEMQQGGLHEVANPSTILLTKSEEELSGTTIGVLTEGLRPMMIEIQALVSSAVYGTPQRSSTGFDARRLNMLLAVLEKRCGFRLGAKDVFLNITGGLKVEDPAIDLAVVAAILSSNEDISVSTQSCFAAEVGLTGEIRPVQRIAQRISEAQKLGFEEIYVSQFAKIDPKDFKIEVKTIAKIEELVSHLFG